MGAGIMLGTLFGLIALIFALVLRFDPEARGPAKRHGSGKGRGAAKSGEAGHD